MNEGRIMCGETIRILGSTKVQSYCIGLNPWILDTANPGDTYYKEQRRNYFHLILHSYMGTQLQHLHTHSAE